MNYNYFLNNYGYEPSKGWDGYEKQLNEQGMPTDFHDEFGFGYKPGSATPSPIPSGYEYVDLGLPSGTLWATTDIQDADGNELYFAWGETQGYTAEQAGVDKLFNWQDYKYASQSGTIITKYNGSDGYNVLLPEDDAATVNWGSGWKMPTKQQFEELMDITKAELVEDGIKFEGENGNSIVFKLYGTLDSYGVNGYGEYFSVWSSSLDPEVEGGFSAFEFNCYGEEELYPEVVGNARSVGIPIRPVRS